MAVESESPVCPLAGPDAKLQCLTLSILLMCLCGSTQDSRSPPPLLPPLSLPPPLPRFLLLLLSFSLLYSPFGSFPTMSRPFYSQSLQPPSSQSNGMSCFEALTLHRSHNSDFQGSGLVPPVSSDSSAAEVPGPWPCCYFKKMCALQGEPFPSLRFHAIHLAQLFLFRKQIYPPQEFISWTTSPISSSRVWWVCCLLLCFLFVVSFLIYRVFTLLFALFFF